MSAFIEASSSIIEHIAHRLSSPFDWQTLSKQFSLPHTCHLIQFHHAGDYCNLYTRSCGVSISSWSFHVCGSLSIRLRFGPAFVGDTLTSEALLCPRHQIFCLVLVWPFQTLWHDILLKGLQRPYFGQHVCQQSIISYVPDELVFDIYVGQIIITVGAYEVTIPCP